MFFIPIGGAPGITPLVPWVRDAKHGPSDPEQVDRERQATGPHTVSDRQHVAKLRGVVGEVATISRSCLAKV